MIQCLCTPSTVAPSTCTVQCCPLQSTSILHLNSKVKAHRVLDLKNHRLVQYFKYKHFIFWWFFSEKFSELKSIQVT